MSPKSSANHSVGQTMRYHPVHQNDSNPANMQESDKMPRHLAEDINSSAEGQKNVQSALSENKKSHAASSTRSNKGWRISLAGWDWTLECMFLMLAIGALAAKVSVVATAQDEPIGPWRDSHFNVSINTVVAILSAILTGACMFIVGEVTGQTKWQWFERRRKVQDFTWIDGASKGPWGSFQLLYRISIPHLARLAALTTLVGVAVNPFSQNIIATRNCQPVLTNQTALIPTADWYHVKQSQRPRNSLPSPGNFTLWEKDRLNADPALKASVYSGLWGSSTTVINASTAGLTCPGVNCTFPKYTTVGVCHPCADVSSFIEKSCNTTLSEQYDGVFHPQCKWSLPTGQHLNNYALMDTYFNNRTTGDISINFAIMNSTASTIILPHVPGTFTNVTFLVNTTTNPKCGVDSGNNCGDVSGAPTIELKPMAVECSLFPCARTYAAAVVNDRVVETEIKRTLGTGNWHRVWGDWAPGLYPTHISIDPNEPCSSWWPLRQEPPPCTYEASAALIVALGDFFWGFLERNGDWANWGGAAPNNDVLDVFFGIGVTNCTHVDNVLRGISNSMTSAIRLKGGVRDSAISGVRGAGLITGQVLRADTCIHIRWAWITLPVAVVFLTSLLLIWTIVLYILGKRRPASKSSALPALFHGLDCPDRMVENKLLTIREMEKEATEMWVKLSDGTTGSIRLEPRKL